jgi:hypothetical protein
MIDNGLMMQYFEWYLENDGTLWNKLAAEAKKLANLRSNISMASPCI